MKSRSLFPSAVFAAALIGLLAGASPVAAECDPDTALYEDDFEFLDASWAQPTDNIYVEDGVLVLKNWGQVNFQTTSEAADVCVDATIIDAPDPESSSATILFWWADWDNYYQLKYWADTFFEVRRTVKGQAVTLYSSEKTPALKAGLGQTNHIELKLRAKDFTVFINDTEITRLKGKPPKGGGPIGLAAWANDDTPMTGTFDNFVVSEPAE
jgi:hypothetical protein